MRANSPSCTRRCGAATLATLADDYAEGAETRGEIVIVIAPPAESTQPTAAEIDDLLHAALARVSLKDAVAEVAAATGEPRRAVYARALELTRESPDGAPPAR